MKSTLRALFDACFWGTGPIDDEPTEQETATLIAAARAVRKAWFGSWTPLIAEFMRARAIHQAESLFQRMLRPPWAWDGPSEDQRAAEVLAGDSMGAEIDAALSRGWDALSVADKAYAERLFPRKDAA